MTPASAKAKGRRFQQRIRDLLIKHLGFDECDCKSTSMGAGGTDIQLSRAALDVFPYTGIECKAQERVNIWQAYKQAQAHGDGEAVLFVTKNRAPVLAILDAEAFIKLHKGDGND